MENEEQLNHHVDQFIGIYDNVIPEDFCKHLCDIADNSSFVYSRTTSMIKDRQLVLDSFHAPSVKSLYENALTPCLLNYCSYYPYLSTFNFVSSAALLQVTEPRGGGYHIFHAENVDWNVNDRVLAWMVYLNDVEDGETEFLYQGIKIRPKTGRVVIWPGSFTHLHRGNPPSNTKYVVTGWYQGVNGIRICDTAGSLESNISK